MAGTDNLTRTTKRRQLRTTKKVVAKQATDEQNQYSRQVENDDLFGQLYDTQGSNILKPPYSPDRLYQLYEESSVLPQCVEAYVTNIDGFGFEYEPVTGMLADIPDDVVTKEKQILKEIMEHPNAEETMQDIRKKVRRDLEVTGNGYIEVVRNVRGEPSLFFWADSRKTRLCALEGEPVAVSVEVVRRGQTIKVPALKRFRKFVQAYKIVNNEAETTTVKRYYKEYRDPRVMCSETGRVFRDTRDAEYRKYVAELLENGKAFTPASELIHFKIGTGTYGIPRWVGTIYTVIGLNRADFVNYDLFDNQGIPPLIITVSGGTLTEESLDDLIDLLSECKGTQQFNKTLVLEAEGASAGGIDDTATGARIDIKPMIEFRKDDAMFVRYTENGKRHVREAMRLPALFIGASDDYNYACFSSDTQTLTDQGWKYWYEYKDGMKVATYNPDTEEIEFELPHGFYVYDHDGPMYHFSNRNQDVLVTPNHRMWVKRADTDNWEFVRAEHLTVGSYKFMAESKTTATVTLPDDLDIVPYKGKVYCFGVPNQLFVTRRNGKVSIQGNTATVARAVAEEQIFRPEREAFDNTFHRLISMELGVQRLRVRSKGPELVLDELAQKSFPYMLQYGAFTIDELIEYANKVLGEDIQLYNEDWSQVPIPVLQSVVGNVASELLGIEPDSTSSDTSMNDDPQVPNNLTNAEKINLDIAEKLVKLVAKFSKSQRPEG